MGIEALQTINFSRIKGILWDLDDTLYHYQPAHEAGYEACKDLAEREFNIPAADFVLQWELARKSNHNQLQGQAASHSRLLYLQKLHENLFGYTRADFSLRLEEVYWSRFLENMKWQDGIEEFLVKANEAKLKMAVVTDLTAQIQLRKWQKLNLGRFMQFLISSEEAGREKPDQSIFLLALHKLQLKKNEVLVIGDNYKKDIEGANALGIEAIWFK